MVMNEQRGAAPIKPVLVRAGFATGFGVLAATLGSAVGLGNIWKFPYLTGANGGAGFLLVYVLATLLVGLPVMIVETMLGRAARANAITTFDRVAPRAFPHAAVELVWHAGLPLASDGGLAASRHGRHLRPRCSEQRR